MIRSALRHPILWVVLAVLLIGILGVSGALAKGESDAIASISAGQTQTTAADQAVVTDIPYSHQVHVDKVGIQCLFCHNGAIRGPQATLPSLKTCATCHDYITVDADAQDQVDQVMQAYQQNARVQWPDVYKQPDYVYFDHRPHIANGVACQTCHGDVQKMTLVTAQVDINMGFCLDCHRKRIAQNPEMPAVEKERLTDCVTCHK